MSEKTKKDTQEQLEKIAGRLERRARNAGAASLEASGVHQGYRELTSPNSRGGTDSLTRDPYGVGNMNQVKFHHHDPENGRATTIISDAESGQLAFGAPDAMNPQQSIQLFDNPNPDVSSVRMAAASQVQAMKNAIPLRPNK